VLATQNPIEQEGTYPLPEAQLDRFLLQIDVNYPDLDTEKAILLATTGAKSGQAKSVLKSGELEKLQGLVRHLPIGDKVVDAILELVRSARPGDSEVEQVRTDVAWGPGPRAGQALMLATRAKALLEGRISPSIDDVLDLAGPVLRHRMALTFAARADGRTLSGTIAKLQERIS
jgi:MoxR-like ATPase